MVERLRHAKRGVWHPRALTLAAVLVVAGLAAGCGSSDGGSSTSGSTSGGKAAKVAFVSYADNDLIQAEVKGVENAVKPNGGSVTLFNANVDPQKQTSQCQDAISSRRFNAIVLDAVDPATGVPCVNAAKAAGVPVVAIEGPVGKDRESIQPQVDGVVGVVVAPPTAYARLLAQIVDKACAGADPCKVIAEVATPTDFLSNKVVQVVQDEVPNVQIAQKVTSMYDPSVLAKALPNALAAHPDANVFLGWTDTDALAVVPVIRSAGRYGKMRIVGNGGSRLGTKAVKDGTFFGTVALYPVKQGEATGELVDKAVNGEQIATPGVDALKFDGPYVITKENVDAFKPEWGAGG